MTDIELITDVLLSHRIRMIGNSLQLCYDQDGFKYDLPIFMINEPDSFEISNKIQENIETREIKV